MSLFVDIEKKLGSFLLKLSFEASNETVALLGASGCGKSMTLKCIAGIEKPDKGKIILDDVTLFDSEKGINLPPQKRNVGLLFQNYALFPNMTVYENIYAGTKKESDKSKRKEAVNKVINDFKLSEIKSHFPNQLSGGEQQRVALARLLVSEPRILMLDEPFSALDEHLRFSLEQDLRNMIHSYNKTVLWVSHNRDEIYRNADKIAVMNNGRIDIFGSKKEVFAEPKTKNAAILTGCKNISPIEKLSDNRLLATDWGIELTTKENIGNAKYIGIRMHYIECSKGINSIKCSVQEIVENPFSYTIMLRPTAGNSKKPIGWETEKTTWNNINQTEITICLPPESLILLEES